MINQLLLMVTIVGCLTHWGCTRSEVKLKMESAQSQLLSEDWQNRKQGLFVLNKVREEGHDLDKKTAEVLVKTLKEEVEVKESFEKKGKAEGKRIHQIEEKFDRQFPPYDYGMYLEDLVILIENLRIKEGIPIIFRFILGGGYVSSGAALTNFGTPAFDFLIDRATKGPNDERELAMSMLSIWINPPQNADHIDAKSVPPLTKPQKERLKLVLLEGLESSDLDVKYYTIRGLGSFLDEPGIKTKLLKLASEGESEEIRSQAKRVLKNVTE